jgi:hypothetical protein
MRVSAGLFASIGAARSVWRVGTNRAVPTTEALEGHIMARLPTSIAVVAVSILLWSADPAVVLANPTRPAPATEAEAQTDPRSADPMSSEATTPAQNRTPNQAAQNRAGQSRAAQNGAARNQGRPSSASAAILEGARRVYVVGQRISVAMAMRLDEARLAEDRRWYRCLDRKLAEVNATLGVVELRYAELEQRIEHQETSRLSQLQSILDVLRRRLVDLERGALACPGENVRVSEGRTRVRVTVEPVRGG